MLNEFLFTKIEEEDIGDRIISCRADVVWPPRSCDLTPLNYYLWGVVKDRCYADKPETIDALKNNIREAIDEIQLPIEKATAWPAKEANWMKLFSINNRKDCTFK